jgi:DNA (cytosine-5)-methyltransferase 1
VLAKKGNDSLKVINSLVSRNLRFSVRDKETRQSDCIKAIVSSMSGTGETSISYALFEQTALSAYFEYINGRLTFEEAEPRMSAYISIQKLLLSVKELYDNDIIIDCLRLDDTGVYVDVQSFPVIEYINKRLGQYYKINADVLNAAGFGAPQIRERFIGIGIRENLIQQNNIKPELPEAIYKPKDYRTVSDAIKDLEQLKPEYNVNEVGIRLSDISYKETALTSLLRDSDVLHNHIITETREKALKRFASLKPGQNFHDLDVNLIKDTYTQPERTQNSIYQRLEYDKPSGTVTNVRKAMWIHPELNRAVSIREAARLQTFPDSFVFVGSKDSQYQQIGNAVPPLMAKAIAEKLAEQLEACNTNINQGELTYSGFFHSGTAPTCNVQYTFKEHESRADCKEVSTQMWISV